MKTYEAKYEIGGVVYADAGDGIEIKIRSILISESENIEPSVQYNGDWFEFELYPTLRALYEARIERIQRQIDALPTSSEPTTNNNNPAA
jgi:hypothetical protein